MQYHERGCYLSVFPQVWCWVLTSTYFCGLRQTKCDLSVVLQQTKRFLLNSASASCECCHWLCFTEHLASTTIDMMLFWNIKCKNYHKVLKCFTPPTDMKSHIFLICKCYCSFKKINKIKSLPRMSVNFKEMPHGVVYLVSIQHSL